MADTLVALVVAAVAAVAVVALRWWLGRWRESVIVVVAIVGELMIFLAITALVHRDRPPVVRLDGAPPTSSFPSGHTGAAVALYACVAVLLLRTVPHRPLARILAVLAWPSRSSWRHPGCTGACTTCPTWSPGPSPAGSGWRW